MLTSFGKIKSLLVVTESGVRLGRVYDISIDAETHAVVAYLVRQSLFASEKFLVKSAQVREISAEKIVVEDSILKEREEKEMKRPSAAPVLGDVTMSKEGQAST